MGVVNMKIVTIVGARPQFVKEAIIQNEINKYDEIEEIVVHTGQHYDNNMSGVFFDVLNMKDPKYNLGINASSHGEMTGKMLIELEKIMYAEKPDIVLLHGDTNSTLAGALAASKLKIRIAHIEAGVRQAVKDMPEEINRVLTDRISTYLFVPSQSAVDNLAKEGIVQNVHLSGDVMYDIFLKLKSKFDYSLMDKLNLESEKFVLMTLHRDYNVDKPDKLKSILEEVNRVSKEIPVILPIHPRTKKRIEKFSFEEYLSDIIVIEPIDYLQLMGLTENCFKVITDSGGFQKEAYFAGKNASVIMPDTSWRELISNGHNTLVDANEIYGSVINKKVTTCTENIYGDGTAAKKIINFLRSELK